MSSVKDTAAHALISSLTVTADPHNLRLRDHADWLPVLLSGSRSGVGSSWTGLSETYADGNTVHIGSTANTIRVVSDNAGDFHSGLIYATDEAGTRIAPINVSVIGTTVVNIFVFIPGIQTVERFEIDGVALGNISVYEDNVNSDRFIGIAPGRSTGDRLEHSVALGHQLFPVSLDVASTVACRVRVELETPTQASEWFHGIVTGSAHFDLRGFESAPALSHIKVDALCPSGTADVSFTLNCLEGLE